MDELATDTGLAEIHVEELRPRMRRCVSTSIEHRGLNPLVVLCNEVYYYTKRCGERMGDKNRPSVGSVLLKHKGPWAGKPSVPLADATFRLFRFELWPMMILHFGST